MQNMEKNLESVRARIEAAAKACGRDPESISLLAVSKRKPAADIRLAHRFGQREFGENYLQEAQEKMRELADLDLCWHFIGAIQSNKTRPIAESFDWAHCIDRIKIARRLGEQRPPGLAPLNVCIQVNLDHEESKAGVDPGAVPELAAEINDIAGIRMRGLMAIPAPRENPRDQHAPFARLREMLDGLQRQGIDCDTLSMGMSADLEAAIAEGATLVRIGTAIFGERS